MREKPGFQMDTVAHAYSPCMEDQDRNMGLVQEFEGSLGNISSLHLEKEKKGGGGREGKGREKGKGEGRRRGSMVGRNRGRGPDPGLT